MGTRAAAGSLAAYSCVVVALTMLKSFYRIGYLWDPANQSRRGLSLVPFHEVADAQSVFAPLFGYGGNIAFFVPVGVLAYVVFGRAGRAIAFGAAFSLLMETAQYVFALGLTDVDDLITNTLGAALGAGVAVLAGPRFHRVWVVLGYAVALVFAGLVLAGERLGDPDKVRQVY